MYSLQALKYIWELANNLFAEPKGEILETLELTRDLVFNLMSNGQITDHQRETNGEGIEMQFAILHQGGYWEEKVYRVPGTSNDMTYAQLDLIGKRYVNLLRENNNIFGCYVSDEDYERRSHNV